MKKAVEKARNGGGPTLIEARYIRLLGHFVADDQWYRDLKADEIFWEYEPIKRMKEYFVGNKLLGEEEVNAIQQDAIAEIADAVSYAQNECTEPPADTLYDDIYADGEIIY